MNSRLQLRFAVLTTQKKPLSIMGNVSRLLEGVESSFLGQNGVEFNIQSTGEHTGIVVALWPHIQVESFLEVHWEQSFPPPPPPPPRDHI